MSWKPAPGLVKLSLIWRRLCKTIGRRLFPPARALCKTSCFLHDIPFLSKVLKRPIRATVLKGRANYLCRRNMAAGNNMLIDDDGNWRELLKFSTQTTDGDIRGAAGVPFNSPLWNVATSTRESCSVQSCDYYNECFFIPRPCESA